MSWRTPCNRCVLNELVRRHAALGQVVTCRPCTDSDLGEGVDVLVHAAGEEPERDKHFVAWLMELTDRCVCDD